MNFLKSKISTLNIVYLKFSTQYFFTVSTVKQITVVSLVLKEYSLFVIILYYIEPRLLSNYHLKHKLYCTVSDFTYNFFYMSGN